MKTFLLQRSPSMYGQAFGQTKLTRAFFCGALFCLFTFMGSKTFAAPISGTFTIGGGTYPTIASAIAALNANGVTAPGATFNVPAGYTETFATSTAGWLNLTAANTSSSPIVFKKSGTGADPLIKAIGTINGDAGILFEGVSYVTFDGIDVFDNGTSFSNYVEYGYAPTYANGRPSSHDTIRNCTITLTPADNWGNGGAYINGTDYYTTIGIYQSYDNSGLASLNVTGSPANGAPFMPPVVNSFNAYTGNTILGAGFGIMLYSSPIIGTSETNNYVANNTLGTSINPIGPIEGEAIFIEYEPNLRVTNNTIYITSGEQGGYGNWNGVYGINLLGSCPAAEIDHNTVTINSSSDFNGGNIDANCVGIGFNGTSSSSVLIHNNTITGGSVGYRNFSCIFDNGTSTTMNIYSNTINGNASLSTNSVPVTGINLTSGVSGSGNVTNVYNNQVFSNSTPTIATGISNSAASGTCNIYSNKIYSLSGTSSSGFAYGISASGGSTQTIYNNFIANLSAGGNNIYGAYINTSVTPEFYFNSIYLNQTTGMATGFTPIGIFSGNSITGDALDARDNLVVNTSTPGTSGTAIALWINGSNPLSGYGSNSDYNSWYAGTPGTQHVILNCTSGSDQTLAAMQTRVTPRDAHSITVNAVFTSSTDLHTTTAALVAGTPITGITTDIDGAVRSLTTPDIGADEFSCIRPGVPTTPSGTTSRCVGSGTNVYTTSSSAATSYTWTVSGAGNTISGTTNSATVTWSSTYTGVATVSVTGTNQCGTSTAGTTTVTTGGLNGAYTIDKTVSGAGNLYPNTNTFNSFSTAIAALTSSCGMAGPVTFNVIAGETFNENPLSIAFTSNPPTATNTLTFVKSGAGANPVINSTGTTNWDAGILLEGVSYTTIDGINVFDAGNVGSDNWIEYGIALLSKGGTLGCQHDIIRNCTVTLNPNDNWLNGANGSSPVAGGAGDLYVNMGIAQFYETAPLSGNWNTYNPSASTAVNSNNSYYGNTVLGASYGIFFYGTTGASESGNEIGIEGGNTVGTSANPIGPVDGIGICIENQTSFRCTNNTVYVNVTNAYGGGAWAAPTGIFITGGSTQEYDHNTITMNSTGDLSQNGGDINAYGITFNAPRISTAYAGSATVDNNVISNAAVTYRNFYGIDDGTATSMNIYNNTISNNTVSGSTSANLTGIGAASTTGGGTVNIYDNRIFTMTVSATTTSWMYGMNISGASTISIYNNFISDFHCSGYNIFGADISTTGSTKFYYNSIYINQSTVPTSGFMVSFGIYLANASTNPVDFRNNIVINDAVVGTGSATALYSLGSGTAVNSYDGYATTSNNNDYYAGTPGTQHLIFQKGNANPISFQTLLGAGSFSAASGRDLNSISVDPGFTSATDLHQTNMTTYGPLVAGQPIAGITTDIDGDTRNATTPDIGADEFGCSKPTVPTTPTGVTSRCAGSGTNVYTTSSTGAVSYNWTVSGTGNTISGSTTNSATVTWSSTYSGSATVSVTATNVCGTTTAGTVSVTVNAAPTATISGTLTGCAQPGIALGSTGSVAGSGSISGYQWQLAAGNIAGATTGTYTATSTGSYNLIVANSNGCSATSSASAVTANAVPIINTYASSNTFGLGTPYCDVRADGLGNVFIGDSKNNRVLKVNSSGVMSTFYTGTKGDWEYDGIYLATDPSGNVYVSSYDDNAIYKLSPAGALLKTFDTTLLNGTFGIAYDPTTGILYSSIWDGVIVKVNPTTGVTTNFVTSASLDYPWGLAVDASGNLYLANGDGNFITDNHVYKITPDGTVSVFAGMTGVTGGRTGDGGAATSARLSQPTGVCVDGAGNVYIADQINNVIREVSASTGIISTFAGINDGGSGNGLDGGLPTSARLNSPYNVSYDPSNGNIYISDNNNTRIRVVTPGLPLPSTPSGPASRCQGSGTSVYTSFVTGATSYSWSVTGAGNTIAGTGSSVTVTWSSGFSGTAMVSVTGSDACATSPAATLNVTVNTPPVATASASPNPVCTSGTLTLTGGPTAMTTYAWTGPNSYTNATQSPNISGAPLASAAGVYTLTVTDGNGCTSTANTVSVAVGSPLSAPSVPTGPNLRCAGAGTSPYTVSAVPGATSYVWSVSGTGNTISGTTNSTTVTWSSTYSGIGTVSVMGSNAACGAGPSSGLFVSVTPALSGTYTIDNTVSGFLNLFPATRTFNSVASAIAQLNSSCGFASPGVTFLVKPGLTETFTSSTAGWINISNTSASPIVFEKNGSGADPLIKGIGNSATSTTAGDAVIVLNGASYITFDGIDLADAGTSFSNYVEYGYVLLGSNAVGRGNQHDTIRNCTVTLNPGNNYNAGGGGCYLYNNDLYTTIGIFQCMDNATFTGYQSYSPCSSTTTNSYNSYYSNTILNCGFAIVLGGSWSCAFDTNNDIGTKGGNIFGTSANPIGPLEAQAIRVDYQNNLRCTNNSVYVNAYNASGGGGSYWITSGILINAGSNSEFDHNTISYTSTGDNSQIGGDINGCGIAFYVPEGSSSTINIHDNSITVPAVSYKTFSGIFDNGPATTMNIYNNTISNVTSPSGNSVAVTGINLSTSVTGSGTTTVHDNILTSLSSAAAVTGINGAQAAGTLSMYNNKINTLSVTAGGGASTGMSLAGAGTISVYNNFISNLTSVGNNIYGASWSGNGTCKFYYNSLYFNQTTGLASAFTPIGILLATTVANTFDMRNNVIDNKCSPGASGNVAALFNISGSGTFTGYATTSDYNDIYAGTPASNHNIYIKTGTGANTYQTLSAFATASGTDAHSITIDPGFTSTTDLHKTNMTYPGYLYLIAGEPITGYTTDIDGDTRSLTIPDMGADEFVACEPSRAGTVTGSTSVCQNDNNVVYSVATIAGATGYNWTLPSGGILLAGANTSSITVDFSGVASSGNVSVNGTDGCGAGLSSSLNVTVKPVPLLVVNPNNAVCTGTTSAALTASGASTYTWLPTTNLTPIAGTSAIETAQISALTIYTVTGTGANGCTANTQVPVATVAVGGTISAPFSIICSGGTEALSVISAAGHDYQWQISTDNINWTNITGATNTSYTTASGDGNSNKFYRMLAQSNSCWNVASTTAEVDVSIPNISVTATNITDNSITLNWSPTGTGNYSISYSGPTSATFTSVTPSKTITGLTANGTYSVTVTQTGVSGCPASGILTGVTTLCAMPTSVTLSSPSPAQIQVSWTGVAGADYRVYYRPLFSYNTYFTKDVSNASSVLITKQGANNLYASTTYEVYVSRLDCPNTGAVGQGTNPTNVTTLPTVTCATPVIDSVRSLCPVQLEVFIHDNGVNQYNVFIQRLTPSILAVNSYGVSGTYFTINTPYSGDQYLIAVEAKCGSTLSALYVYPGNVTVKPLCNAPANLVLSNPTCHGFTASWNDDRCLSNSASGYDFYLRVAGTINYNSYGVGLPVAPVGPNELINFATSGRTYQVFVRSIYNCNGFVTYGPTSQVETITTLSSGCRDEDVEQPAENKPAVQQYSPDNSEVFSLYPNPNTGKFVVDLSRVNMEEDAVRIEVINMLGQTVMTQLTTISGGQMSEYVNLPNGTAAGTYIVRLTAGKNVYTSKVNVSK